MGRTVAERIEALLIPEPNSGCWLWISDIGPKGYGQFFVSGRTQRAHRVSWSVYRGPIPDGLMVLHKCDVRCCVNPEHLFLGTAGTNARDMVQKGRHLHGERAANAKLTAAQAIEIRNSTETPTELAKRFGVSRTNIRHIRRGDHWKLAGAAA